MNKTFVPRELYLEKIKPFIDKNIIKVLIGQRRVWKSYLFFQIIDFLKTDVWVVDEQIVFINKELYEFDNIKDDATLLTYIEERKSNLKTYIFIDEVQDILHFEKALRHLQASEEYDIYISGSNAHLLSSEIATFLTGRYLEFEIFPLTYKEFLAFHGLVDSKETFFQYLQFWGLPYLKHLELKEEILREYIKSIYNTILLKDITQRYKIRNLDFLEKLIFFLAENIGNLFTANTISLYLKSQKIDIQTSTILEYLSHLCSVYLVNKVRRQDIVWKKIFAINDKYYFSDVGIRNTILWWYKPGDIGKILENVVFLHFRAHGYTVSIWKLRDKEIDFIVEKWGDKKYIQVAYLIDGEKTKKREFENLLEIRDNYEKIVLSLDDFVAWEYEGIKHYNIREYLLSF